MRCCGMIVYMSSRCQLGSPALLTEALATALHHLLMKRPPPDSSAEGAKGELARQHLVLVPHTGIVYLDWHAGKQVLTHTGCLRRQVVGGEGPWSIVFDEEGYAALVSDADEDVIVVEVFLSRSLYRAAGGELFMESPDEGGAGTRLESLTQKMREYTRESAFVAASSVGEQVEVYYLAWPRGGCHWTWKAADFYNFLSMQSYKGEKSK